MTKTPTWTETELRVAVPLSKTYRELMIALRLAPIGGNYGTLKKYVVKFGLDTSHFLTNSEQAKIRLALGPPNKYTEEEAKAAYKEGV